MPSVPSASADFLLGFDPENGGDMFVRSVWFSLIYTALQPKRSRSSVIMSISEPVLKKIMLFFVTVRSRGS
jgi:hypothetical protein